MERECSLAPNEEHHPTGEGQAMLSDSMSV